jgi:hypothetical protein
MGVAGAVVGSAVIGGVASNRAADTAAGASADAAAAQAGSSKQARRIARRAKNKAQGFFEPFAGAAERGVAESDFLANPEAQFDFLQNNPLFNLALENANQQTNQSAASRGRLSAGDTLQQLSNNVLLSAQPLIDRQRQDVGNLLNLGTGVATSQANIETGQAAHIAGSTTDIGAANAAGIVGAANAENAGTAGMAQALQMGLLGASGGFGGGGGVPINQNIANTTGVITPQR